jgi:hypothetical protein
MNLSIKKKNISETLLIMSLVEDSVINGARRKRWRMGIKS